MDIYKFNIVRKEDNSSLHNICCSMERAKELATEECGKHHSTIELQAVNAPMYRIERLAYYIWCDVVSKDGSSFGLVKEELNWHPYSRQELIKKGISL